MSQRGSVYPVHSVSGHSSQRIPDGPSHSSLLSVPSQGGDAHFWHMSQEFPLSLKMLMVTQGPSQDSSAALPESVEQGQINTSTSVSHGVSLRKQTRRLQGGATQVPEPRAAAQPILSPVLPSP